MGQDKQSKKEDNRFFTTSQEQNRYTGIKPKIVSKIIPFIQPKIGPYMLPGRKGKTAGDTSAKLPQEVQAKMEDSFGQDFSEVTIHKDSSSAQDINAKAYTQGTDVHFAPGEYNPSSKEGQELIGHELTHVVQQGQGRVGTGEVHGKGLEINQDAGLEKEADEMGRLAANGEIVNVSTIHAGSIQRKIEDNQTTTEAEQEAKFKAFKITKDDLSNTYVIEEFKKMTFTQLFDYRDKAEDIDVKSYIITVVKDKPKTITKSYEGQTFTIDDSNAVVRNDDLTEKKYVKEDAIPEGKKEGDSKIIPKDTEVFISEYKYVSNGKRYVKIVDYGWTSAGNIKGDFYNETLGLTKTKWDSQDSKHKTVGNYKAVIRELDGSTFQETKQTIAKGKEIHILETSEDKKFVLVSDTGGKELGWTSISYIKNEKDIHKINVAIAHVFAKGPNYKVTEDTITQGAYVIIKEESEDTEPKGKYVKVASVKKDKEEYVEDALLGWTTSTNLVEGWSNYKGDTAEWEKDAKDGSHGNYIGQTDLVDIVGKENGSEGQIEKISIKMLEPYNILKAAAEKDGIGLTIGDGFRRFSKQQSLWDANPNPQKVAKPGRSNHQHGQALDLRTGGFDSAVYKWLVKNGPTYGWIRTVSGEDWHWEYLPGSAKLHGYKFPTVSP